MKKIFLMATMFAALFSFSGCGDDDSEDLGNAPVPVVDEDNSSVSVYNGTVTVVYKGEDVATDNIESTCKIIDSKTLTIGLNDVKFVPQMPITISLEVPGIAYQKEDGVITFQADKIVPTMAGNPVEAYTATNLKGEIGEDGKMSYTLSFGSYPTSFEGKLVSK